MNDRHTVGGNNPPALTPFEEISDTINDLYAEAKQWLDGEPVTSPKEADEINKLINLIRAAEKEADERRKTEAAPFDEAKAEIQARYGPLIADTKSTKGKTVLALQAAKTALTPWLEKIDLEKREIERVAREKADTLMKAVQDTFQNTSSTNLAGREEAEKLLEEAKQAEIQALVAEKDKAHAKGGAGRATGLRTTYRAEITNMLDFARWYWHNRKPEMTGIFTECANKLVVQNHEVQADGLTVHEERKAV